MTIDFYYKAGSPPCRAVQLTAIAVGVEVNLKVVDLAGGAHLTPEFLAINPQHNIPVLVDNGFVVTESRAIMTYLVDRYGKPDDGLYPRDPQKRALINQRLFFDQGTLYESFANYFYPVLFGAGTYDPSLLLKIERSLELLNTFLEGQTFVAGDNFTIADIALVVTCSSFLHSEGGYVLGKKYPNVSRWFNKCKQVTPRYDLNVAGLREFKGYFKK